ncbi:MAG TPA: response regulator [Polyangia bacterium]|jgi:two-component system response regulator MprA|nr:response regulator [Polyangia bacterium]
MHAAALATSPIVLVVDDDVDILQSVAELLVDEGYDVATASDGRAALEQMRRGLRPDVILLDLMMPGMNGWDFRAEQMQDDNLKGIPVIVITATDISDTALKAQLGDIGLVRKPPTAEALLTVIRETCGEPIR